MGIIRIDNRFWDAVLSAVIDTEIRYGLPKYPGTGKYKKEIVVNFLTNYINIPYIPKPLKRLLIGWAVDGVVYILNQTLGRLWIKRIHSPT